MAGVPKDLLEEIKKLEAMFTIDTAKLKEITDRFQSELERGMSCNPPQLWHCPNFCVAGLSKEGGTIVSRPCPRTFLLPRPAWQRQPLTAVSGPDPNFVDRVT